MIKKPPDRAAAAFNPSLAHCRPLPSRWWARQAEELKTAGLKNLQAAVELLEQKATADEVDTYKRFVLDLAARVANAHREHGVSISEAEQAALDAITATLTPPSG